MLECMSQPERASTPPAWLNLDERSSMQEHTIGSGVLARFWAKVNKNGPNHPKLGTPCWLWTAAVSSNGYGSLTLKSKGWTAHTFVWVIENGPIAPGLYVCHQCDVRLCVNPAHLFLGTPLANVHDMIAKGRSRAGFVGLGEKNPRAKLTANDVLEIRAKYATGGVTQTGLAKRYGVTVAAISLIVKRQKWQHI